MAANLKPDHTLDTKGMLCPQPVLKTKVEMDKLIVGQILEILATDPGADSDIRAWAKHTGNTYISSETEEDVWKIYVKKK